MSPLVTLLTDFGTVDPYVAEVKGRVYAEWLRFPDPSLPPTLVDITHEVPPGDVAAGAWLLSRAAPAFPPLTVHLAVVDPGVGAIAPAIAVAAAGQFFVGPGNGLFGFLARGQTELQVVRLDNPLYHRGPGGRPSATFHGRDIFAPVAAHLARGVPLWQVGTAAGAELLGRSPEASAPGREDGAATLGRIVWIDRFGNAITDVRRDGPHSEALVAGAELWFGATAASGPVATFAAGPADRPFWYWGSGGTLEAARRGRDAAALHGWRVGMAVRRDAP